MTCEPGTSCFHEQRSLNIESLQEQPLHGTRRKHSAIESLPTKRNRNVYDAAVDGALVPVVSPLSSLSQSQSSCVTTPRVQLQVSESDPRVSSLRSLLNETVSQTLHGRSMSSRNKQADPLMITPSREQRSDGRDRREDIAYICKNNQQLTDACSCKQVHTSFLLWTPYLID